MVEVNKFGLFAIMKYILYNSHVLHPDFKYLKKKNQNPLPFK